MESKNRILTDSTSFDSVGYNVNMHSKRVAPNSTVISNITNIRYINGINTVRETARFSAKVLKESIKDWYQFSGLEDKWDSEYSFGFFYNQTDSIGIDLAETFIQKYQEKGRHPSTNRLYWQIFRDVIINEIYNQDTIDVRAIIRDKVLKENDKLTVIDDDYIDFSDKYYKYLNKFTDSLFNKAMETKPKMETEIRDSIVSLFTNTVYDSTITIIIAHSQGNMY